MEAKRSFPNIYYIKVIGIHLLKLEVHGEFSEISGLFIRLWLLLYIVLMSGHYVTWNTPTVCLHVTALYHQTSIGDVLDLGKARFSVQNGTISNLECAFMNIMLGYFQRMLQTWRRS